jgi:hypothetical protein
MSKIPRFNAEKSLTERILINEGGVQINAANKIIPQLRWFGYNCFRNPYLPCPPGSQFAGLGPVIHGTQFVWCCRSPTIAMALE